MGGIRIRGLFCFLGFHLLLEYVCPFVILLMMGMGTALTGLIIKMKVVTVCGVVGALASVGCIYVHGFDQILVFASAFVFMMVIPGHYLNGMAKQDK